MKHLLNYLSAPLAFFFAFALFGAPNAPATAMLPSSGAAMACLSFFDDCDWPFDEEEEVPEEPVEEPVEEDHGGDDPPADDFWRNTCDFYTDEVLPTLGEGDGSNGDAAAGLAASLIAIVACWKAGPPGSSLWNFLSAAGMAVGGAPSTLRKGMPSVPSLPPRASRLDKLHDEPAQVEHGLYS